jgi:hypothetical protein
MDAGLTLGAMTRADNTVKTGEMGLPAGDGPARGRWASRW